MQYTKLLAGNGQACHRRPLSPGLYAVALTHTELTVNHPGMNAGACENRLG